MFTEAMLGAVLVTSTKALSTGVPSASSSDGVTVHVMVSPTFNSDM